MSDQIGAPKYTKDLAEFIINFIQTNYYGTYHGFNDCYCSWHKLAESIFRISRVKMKANPISTEEYPTKAKRPLNSKLSKEKTT